MKKAVRYLLMALVFGYAIQPRSGFALDGESLHGFCNTYLNELPEPSSTDALLCGFYVAGVVDSLQLNTKMEWGTACFPDDVSRPQIIAATHAWLRDNPKSWPTLASYSVFMAIKESWPCK